MTVTQGGYVYQEKRMKCLGKHINRRRNKTEAKVTIPKISVTYGKCYASEFLHFYKNRRHSGVSKKEIRV